MRRAFSGAVPAAMQMQQLQKTQTGQLASYNALIEKGVPIGPAEQAEFLPDADELAKMDKEIAATE